MITAVIDNNSKTGKYLINELKRHPKVVHFIDSEEMQEDIEIPEGYVFFQQAKSALAKIFNERFGDHLHY